MKTLFYALLVLLTPIFAFSQFYEQYFDGANTNPYNSLIIQIDPDSNNVWQIGEPEKNLFDTAATAPNVIVTDTADFYPSNNTSIFTFEIDQTQWFWGILALQWKQKLDMDAGNDGGTIEFSMDGGSTWEDPWGNPFVYNFYGFDAMNADSFGVGHYGFTGLDTTWKDIWLCFDVSYLQTSTYNILFRYTLHSDSVQSENEGWMIDNMLAHLTYIHTIGEEVQTEYLKVFPTVTKDRVNIHAKKLDQFHIIEEMDLVSAEGKTLGQWKNVPTKFWIDMNPYPPGVYFLHIRTNYQEETFKLIRSAE